LHSAINKIYQRELHRQRSTVELIASENFASDAVMKLCGSEFTNKYAEGYPTKRYYNGCEHMDEIEQFAIDEVAKLYDCDFANVQPHSGANANLAVMHAFLNPGDTIVGMDLSAGGHLSHGSSANISGKQYTSFHYGVDNNGLIDLDIVESLVKNKKPKMLIAGASAYPRQIDWKVFREIADNYGAMLLVDMSHYSGLIAGFQYDNPCPYAHIVTSTTHKTLRGPRGGMILWNDLDLSKKINSAVFPGTQGGPLMNIIAAKAQCFVEARDVKFTEYAHDVIHHAKIMAAVFEENGVKTVTSGTDSHIVLVDLQETSITGKQLADQLEKTGITVNKNSVPNDPRSFLETSGIRIGTAAETTRGRNGEWFKNLAMQIVEIIRYYNALNHTKFP